jgi:LmbE family N-acetylglucosaminyl deacetylase
MKLKRPNEIRGKNILAFGAHPDDLEFYAGGTLAKLSKNNRVKIVMATSGENGGDEVDLARIRKKEQYRAAKVLNIREVKFLNQKDGDLSNANNLKKLVGDEVYRYRPDVVFSFDPWNMNQLHPDHRALSEIVFDSVINSSFKINNVSVERMYLFDSLYVNYIEDISNYWKIKLIANKKHKSQIKEFKNGWREKERILSKLAKIYGKSIGVDFGEGFRLLNLDPNKRYLENSYMSINSSKIFSPLSF